MKNIFFVCSFILLALMSTGCFELTEELNMDADGSGKMKLTLNMSESKDNLSGFMKSGQVEGIRLPSQGEIDSYLTKVRTILSQVEGLSDLELLSDYQQFVFTLTARFDRVESLNAAVNTLVDELNQSGIPTIRTKNFSFDNKVFARHFDYPVKLVNYQKLGAVERFVLETARLVSIYRFENSVKDYSNRDARLSPSKKAVMMMHTLGDVIQGKASLENKISF